MIMISSLLGKVKVPHWFVNGLELGINILAVDLALEGGGNSLASCVEIEL